MKSARGTPTTTQRQRVAMSPPVIGYDTRRMAVMTSSEGSTTHSPEKTASRSTQHCLAKARISRLRHEAANTSESVRARSMPCISTTTAGGVWGAAAAEEETRVRPSLAV